MSTPSSPGNLPDNPAYGSVNSRGSEAPASVSGTPVSPEILARMASELFNACRRALLDSPARSDLQRRKRSRFILNPRRFRHSLPKFHYPQILICLGFLRVPDQRRLPPLQLRSRCPHLLFPARQHLQSRPGFQFRSLFSRRFARRSDSIQRQIHLHIRLPPFLSSGPLSRYLRVVRRESKNSHH